MTAITLYSPNTTDFTTNGLGALNDTISAIVVEERNGTFELQLKYPITGRKFTDIAHSCIIKCMARPGGNYQLFRIYSISKPMNGIIIINAEHISYQLSYIAVDAFNATSVSEAMVRMKQKAMTNCPFDFWTDKTTIANYNQQAPDNIRARLGGVEGSILDVYGGEYEFDNYTIKLHNHRGIDRGVELRYGKNIIDLSQEENIASVYTSIVGYWKNEDNTLRTDVINSDYAGAYPFNRTKVVDFSADYEEQPTLEQLNARARQYMVSNSFGIPHVSIKVSFVALWQTEEYKDIAPLERVYLCDTVSIKFEKLGISARAKVVKTTYNVLLDRYDSIELGETSTNLSKKLAEQTGEIQQGLNNTKSELEKSIDRATQLITGNRGGHVVTRVDGDGKPYELLIMDTDDVATAQKVWRFNLDGWGYSSTGINGQYRLAATQDGHIVADFVDTGTLTANIIKAGILTDANGLNYWNMATGEFKLSSTVMVGNSTVASAANVASALVTAEEYADNGISNYDGTLNQLKVFNKLTNNGTAQGVALSNGNLYVNASYINTGTLSADRIAANSIAVGKLTGTIANGEWNLNLNDGTFTIGKISANNITAGTIDASKITVTNLNANNITSGTLSADKIKGGTLSLGAISGYADGSIVVNTTWGSPTTINKNGISVGNSWGSVKINSDGLQVGGTNGLKVTSSSIQMGYSPYTVEVTANGLAITSGNSKTQIKGNSITIQNTSLTLQDLYVISSDNATWGTEFTEIKDYEIDDGYSTLWAVDASSSPTMDGSSSTGYHFKSKPTWKKIQLKTSSFSKKIYGITAASSIATPTLVKKKLLVG